MKRGTLLSCIIMMAVLPSVVRGDEFFTFFPPNAQYAAVIETSSTLDDVHHAYLGLNLVNVDLFFVLMTADGTPAFDVTPRPWLYGQLIEVTQLGPNSFRVTWNMQSSPGGFAEFTPVGPITIVINI